MVFPIPEPRVRDTADALRDAEKRRKSPGSFFYSQGQSQVLAATYFRTDRLAEHARGAVSSKHMHRIQMALFGQLMAAFEYFLKDFVAKAIDATPLVDETLKKQKWLEIDVDRVLANRSGSATVGATLVHTTMGWHYPAEVNVRYSNLFNFQAIPPEAIGVLEKLWILRHSVAHNAGFVTHWDATRIGSVGLADHAADIDGDFIRETFDFLAPIVQSVTETCGGNLLRRFFEPLRDRGQNFREDAGTYEKLKYLSLYISRRSDDLPAVNAALYRADFDHFAATP